MDSMDTRTPCKKNINRSQTLRWKDDPEFFFRFFLDTLPKTNIAPKNGGFQ